MTRPRVQLLGRLEADPEFCFTPTGEGVAHFELSTSPSGPAGVPGATRHRCVAWNQGGRRLADLVVEHLRAGAVVYVEGHLQPGPRRTRAEQQAAVLVLDVQLLEDPALREPRTQ